MMLRSDRNRSVAYVKVGQIKATLAKSVAYITRPDATSDGIWVSTNTANVDPADFKGIARAFADTVERVGVSSAREGSVLAHHVIQSFDPSEEISVHRAHELGVQLIESMTGGEHEYVIATHIDKGHIHNHIMFNPVNMTTGKRYRMTRDRLGEFRAASDDLCVRAGASVIDRDPRASGKTGWSQQELYRVIKGDSGQQYVRTEIDKAARQATSWEDFERALLKRGVVVSRRGGRDGTLSYKIYGAARPIRDYKLGRAYTEASVMARLAHASVNRIGVDASMIIRESKTTMTVVVPGTQRELTLTVQKSQIVRRGRSIRIYVPATGRHVLASRDGKLAKTVNTAGLYEFYSKPDVAQFMKHAEPSVGRGWSGQLAHLRELTREVNARSRWVREQGLQIADAITSAREQLTERHMAYQSALVAVADHLAQPGAGDGVVRVLEAELRTIERDLTRTEQDVRALMNIKQNEEKTMAGDSNLSRRAGRDHIDRERAHDEYMHAEQVGQEERCEDQAVDRNGPMSLEDRLRRKIGELREDAEQDREQSPDDDRSWGKGR